MTKKETSRQHLVPKCYLRNFKVDFKQKKSNKLYYIDAFDKKNPEKGIYRINIDNACVENDWYTFTNLEGKDRLVLEDYFACTIEHEYPALYKKLVEEKTVKLSNRDRHQIVKFCVFQYFRTSKLTNQFNDFWGTVLNKANRMAQAHGQPLKIQWENGKVMDFSDRSIEEVIKDQSRRNQESINAMTFTWATELIESRKKDIITVEKVENGQKLFTSDNPVYFFGSPFDPNTLIKMPLDHEHLLTIFPAAHHMEGVPKYFFSNMPESMSDIETTFNNLYQLDNAERFTIGEGSIISEYQEKNKNFDIEKYLEKVRFYTKKWTEQTEYIEKNGKLPENFVF